jgi:hypothetical protein
MVSIEEQFSYNQKIESNVKMSALKDMLSGQSVVSPNANIQISETDRIYYEITAAIQTNDKDKFLEFFNKKNKSNPNKDNPPPFVHDDFLIFSLIIGIIKFNCDKVWIKNVISIRTKNNITTTFENILNGNFFHSENIKSVIFMFLHSIDQSEISPDFANQTFTSISTNNTLLQDKSDLIIICALLSYNLIIELKTLPDTQRIKLLNTFETKFIKKIKILAWLIQTLIIMLLLYAILMLISAQPDIKNFLDKFGSVLSFVSLFGISQIGNVSKWIKDQFIKLLFYLFGYPEGLIQD